MAKIPKLKVLLTGATSKIGLKLIKDHSINFDFYILCRRSTNINNLIKTINKKKIFIYKSNYNELKDFIFKNDLSILIHIASYYSNPHNYTDIQKYINILKLGNYICEIFSKRKNSYIIYLSSYFQFEKDKNNYLYSTYKHFFLNLLMFYNKSVSYTNLVIYDIYSKDNKRQRLLNIIKKEFLNPKVKLNPISLPKKTDKFYLLHLEDVTNGIIKVLKIYQKSPKIVNFKNYSLYNMYQKNTFLELKTIVDNISNEKCKFKFNCFNVSVKKPFLFDTIPGWKPKYDTHKIIKDLIIDV